MINAAELRIGNWFYSKGLNFVCQISEIRQETVSICGKTLKNELASGLSYSSFDPIPLTEEWLIRFGFEKADWLNSMGISEDICYTNGKISLKIKNKVFMVLLGLFKYKEIQYVHRLQNIYFELEDKELTLIVDNIT